VLSKKAPEEVVTDGYEGATVYMCSVVRDDPIHCTSITFHYNEEGDGPPYQVPHLITPLMYSHSPPSIPPHGAGTMRARRVLFHRNATHRIDRNAPTAPPAAAAPARSPRHLRWRAPIPRPAWTAAAETRASSWWPRPLRCWNRAPCLPPGSRRATRRYCVSHEA